MHEYANASTPAPFLYRPAELAKLLKVSRQTIYNKMASGLIPARKLDGVTLILHEDVVTMLRDLPRAIFLVPAKSKMNDPTK
jgi:excisionase family DNA binding protein